MIQNTQCDLVSDINEAKKNLNHNFPERFDFRSFAYRCLLKDQLFQLGRRGNEPDITVFTDLPPYPPVVVVLLVDVQKVSNFEAEIMESLHEVTLIQIQNPSWMHILCYHSNYLTVINLKSILTQSNDN